MCARQLLSPPASLRNLADRLDPAQTTTGRRQQAGGCVTRQHLRAPSRSSSRPDSPPGRSRAACCSHDARLHHIDRPDRHPSKAKEQCGHGHSESQQSDCSRPRPATPSTGMQLLRNTPTFHLRKLARDTRRDETRRDELSQKYSPRKHYRRSTSGCRLEIALARAKPPIPTQSTLPACQDRKARRAKEEEEAHFSALRCCG